jgi:integrase
LGTNNLRAIFIMAKWINTKHAGIRYREHAERKNGIRRDRYYAIRFMVDGKRKEEALGWETVWKRNHEGGISLEKEALNRLAELEKNRREGTGPRTFGEKRAEDEAKEAGAKAAANRTLAEYWQESYFPAAQRSKKANSWSKEESHFRLWLEPLIGALPLRSIGLKQWDELVKTLSAKGLSPRSKEYITGTLRRILKHGYDRRMVDDSPPSGKRIGVTGPGNNRRMRVISHEEEAAIMEQLSIVDLHAWRVTRFSFLTGCRAGEAFTLTWQNIDRNRGVVVFAETKNRDSRTIPLSKPLQDLFDSMESGTPSRHIFTKADGSPYLEAPCSFRTVVGNLRFNQDYSKSDKLMFHSIRHTVATRLAQRLGPRDLMDVMGWRTVQMAMRYVDGNEDAKTKALAMLGAAPETGKVLPFSRAESQHAG